MKVAIRVDASTQIGTGHVMRCLTLANTLRSKGANVVFLCRPHNGHLIKFIEKNQFVVISLQHSIDDYTSDLDHSNWLATSQEEDVEQCLRVFDDVYYDLIVVDHYGLDYVWEEAIHKCCQRLLVIDDLADRKHSCDVLLDQNYGTLSKNYIGLVPDDCALLTGSDYALLRMEFLEWRSRSLERRNEFELKHLLINLGGVDEQNITSKILAHLNECELPEGLHITVVMGSTAPHLESVKESVKSCKYKSTIRVGVLNMAELMTSADLAIGAAGSTSWERCCLGLPTIQLVTAENQKELAKRLRNSGSVMTLADISLLDEAVKKVSRRLLELSVKCRKVTDGLGSQRVTSFLRDAYMLSKGEWLIPYSALRFDELNCVLRMRNHEGVRKWMKQKEKISWENHLSFISALTDQKDRQFLALREGEHIIGCVNFSKIGQSKQNVELGIFSNPYLSARSKGAKLIQNAFCYAKTILGVSIISLEVYKNNYKALTFYRKFGFIDVSPEVHQSDVLGMYKNLMGDSKYDN